MSYETTATFGTIWGNDALPGEEYKCIWYPKRAWRGGVWLIEGGEHFDLIEVQVGNYAQIVNPMPLHLLDETILTMDTASPGVPITITVKNRTSVPRKFVVEIEELGSTPRLKNSPASAGRVRADGEWNWAVETLEKKP